MSKKRFFLVQLKLRGKYNKFLETGSHTDKAEHGRAQQSSDPSNEDPSQLLDPHTRLAAQSESQSQSPSPKMQGAPESQQPSPPSQGSPVFFSNIAEKNHKWKRKCLEKYLVHSSHLHPRTLPLRTRSSPCSCWTRRQDRWRSLRHCRSHPRPRRTARRRCSSRRRQGIGRRTPRLEHYFEFICFAISKLFEH